MALLLVSILFDVSQAESHNLSVYAHNYYRYSEVPHGLYQSLLLNKSFRSGLGFIVSIARYFLLGLVLLSAIDEF